MVLYESSPTLEPVISATPTSGFTPILGAMVSFNDIDNMPSDSHDNAKPPIQNPNNNDNKTPNDNDNDKNKIKFSENKDTNRHIFRKSDGHFPEDTPEIRELLEELVNNESNYRGPDQHSNHWYSRTIESGKEIWAQVRNNQIINAGINEIPQPYSPITGLCKPARNRIK
jgi:hypothetical protein